MFSPTFQYPTCAYMAFEILPDASSDVIVVTWLRRLHLGIRMFGGRSPMSCQHFSGKEKNVLHGRTCKGQIPFCRLQW